MRAGIEALVGKVGYKRALAMVRVELVDDNISLDGAVVAVAKSTYIGDVASFLAHAAAVTGTGTATNA